MDLDETTLAQVFKQAGYATAAYGKWHNGMQPPYHPNSRGFDDFYGFCSGHWGNYFSPMLEHNGAVVQGEGFLVDDLTNHGIEFIEQNKEKAFLLYLPFNTPHSPMQVPDKWFEKFEHMELEMLAEDPHQEDLIFTKAALAMCENIDWNVGRVLQKLDELELADDTIVLYFSDNGPNSRRWNGDMKGMKGSTDEGGVRSPLVIRWPGHIKPGTKIPQIAGAIDLLLTLADMADIPIKSEKKLDGKSVKPLLLADTTDWPDRMIFSHWSNRVSVRTQKFRLDNSNKLYDMTEDPGQQQDVSDDHPEVTRRLSEESAAWRAEMLPGLRDGRRPFTVGYPEFPITHLPARDGVGHGKVKRSAGAPNCSFFTNWTSTDDRITWDVEVANAGRYEAVIYYTCPEEDLGSTIELSLGESRLRRKITMAHNPPPGRCRRTAPGTESVCVWSGSRARRSTRASPLHRCRSSSRRSSRSRRTRRNHRV